MRPARTIKEWHEMGELAANSARRLREKSEQRQRNNDVAECSSCGAYERIVADVPPYGEVCEPCAYAVRQQQQQQRMTY